MDALQSNVSDHYLVMLTVYLEVKRVSAITIDMPQSFSIKWEKVDKEACNTIVTKRLSSLRTDISSPGMLDLEIRMLNEILVEEAIELAPKKLS